MTAQVPVHVDCRARAQALLALLEAAPEAPARAGRDTAEIKAGKRRSVALLTLVAAEGASLELKVAVRAGGDALAELRHAVDEVWPDQEELT